ncbi:MAG: creatininase family protein [Bacillota bacterium]|nr:creatininase family protein [Bacillota bacterium]
MIQYGANWTLETLETHQTDTVYLPFAAFESSVPYLPLTADLLISEAYARAISNRIGAFLLPVQPFATRYKQRDRYRLGIDADLMYDMTLDLAQEIKRQGFGRLVIQETCSGKSILYALQRHLNAQTIIKTILVNPKNLACRQCQGLVGQIPEQEEIDDALLKEIVEFSDKGELNDCPPGAQLLAAGIKEAVKEIEAAFAFMDTIGSYA